MHSDGAGYVYRVYWITVTHCVGQPFCSTLHSMMKRALQKDFYDDAPSMTCCHDPMLSHPNPLFWKDVYADSVPFPETTVRQ